LLPFALRCRVYLSLAVFLLAGVLPQKAIRAQAVAAVSNRVDSSPRSWSFFTEYSPSSGHILLGYSRGREFFTLGAGFTQRLFENRVWKLAYAAEVRPLMLESDPVLTQVTIHADNGQGDTIVHYPHKIPVINPMNPFAVYQIQVPNSATPLTLVWTGQYSRRWTYVAGFSPAGLQAKFLPHARLQPVITLLTGFAVSPRDIPVFDSSAFNFTFSFGAGLDFFRTPFHAWRLEYRLQHLSNADLGTSNDPGIDSQMIHVGYSWGK
jgi:hypothetical protein